MESIGRYSVIRKIGAGGMAEVFLTRARGAEGTEKLLVIKKIHPVLAKNSKFIDMFVDEARVAMRLNHTNIVQVYAFEQVEGAYLLAMEYVDGVNLLELVSALRRKGERVPPGLAAYVASEVAKGLDYAHSRCDDRGAPLDIVHRDVSPQNILLSRQGAVKIADFGIAKARSLDEEAPNTIKGKFGYMAPEQAAGRQVDRRSDIYALGVVLWELLVGRQLFKFAPGEDAVSVVRERRHPSPAEVDPAVPAGLDAVVRRAMAFMPEDRFATAREMAQELVRYLHSETEIYDSHALEGCVQTALPPADDGEAAGTSELAATHPAGRRRAAASETTEPRLRFGSEEQRAAVVVVGRFEIEPHPDRIAVHAELTRLADEMAYKADAVLRKRPLGFAIYLGVVQSSLEDPIRGIRLAYDLLDAALALGRDHRLRIDIRLAVGRGVVRCSLDAEGAEPHFDPDAGLEQGVAALLDEARPGDILSDGRIYRMARRDYNFEPLDGAGAGRTAHDAESELERSRPFRVTGARSREERIREAAVGGAFHGREPELERLGRALREALQGRLTLLKVAGETGVGKSRLMHHFLATLPRDAVDVIKVECLFAERDRPLASAAAAVRAVLGLGEREIGPDLGRTLTAAIGRAPRYLERQRRFLTDFLSNPDAAWSASRGGQRELVQRVAFGLGVILALFARRRPLVLVVDNAHWIDGPSVDVLSELALERAAVPVLVLLVGQPATLSGRHIAGLASLEVKGLTDNVLKALILERLGPSESMADIADQIAARVNGNPFFAGEIIDSLIDQGVLAPVTADDGRVQYRQARPGTISLPETAQGIALSRIAALPPAQRAVLRAASAVGASFTEDVLSALVERDVAEEIRSLVAEEILVAMPPEPGRPPSFRIAQPMLREAAYVGLSEQDRHRIHRAMADRLIAAAKAGEAQPAVRIAWHLDQAGETEAAGRYYLAAGDAAMAIYSGREALKLYDRAIARLPDSSRERFMALTLRERVLRDLGRYEERDFEAQEMARIARELGEDRLLAHALTRRAQLKYDLGDFMGAANTLGESLEVSVRAGDAAEQVEALRVLAYVAIEEGHLIRALHLCNRALALIPDEGLRSFYLKARSLGIKGFTLTNMGHLDDAAAPLAEALVLFRRLGKRRNESQVMSNLALLAQARGELVEAIDFLESAMRIDAEVRDVSARGRKLAALGAIRTELGDFAAAHANLAEGRVICRDNRERVGLVEADLGLAETLLVEGDAASAKGILEDVGRGGFVERSRLLLVRHRRLTAMVLFALGARSSALGLMEESTRIAFEAGMNGEAIHGGVRLGLILAGSGRPGEALSASRRAADLLAMLGKVGRAEEVWWYHGLTLHKSGSTYRAGKALEAARREVARKRGLIRNPSLRALYDNHPLVRDIAAGYG